MTKSASMHSIIENIGAESLASHLRDKIQADQRGIAAHYASVDGMQYPENLFGEMEELLAKREYNAIGKQIERLRQWIEDVGRIQEMLKQTLILIEWFVLFYKAASGNNEDE